MSGDFQVNIMGTSEVDYDMNFRIITSFDREFKSEQFSQIVLKVINIKL
jgi:hypothetical protein